MGRTTLTAAASAVILATLEPAPPPAEAIPHWLCRAYCEAIHEGCKITLGRLDRELCEDWYEGCKDGCRVKT